MAFWSDAALDPKRQFKFRVTFGLLESAGATQTPSSFLAQSADRPVYTIGDGTKVDFLDKQFHFPGKITWAPVKVKFVDAVFGDNGKGIDGNVNVSQRVYTYLLQTGWVEPNQLPNALEGKLGNFRTISKNRSVAASKANQSLKVEVLNADGNPVDTWTLNNAFITTVGLNNLDYAAEGILTAEFTFRYDWASYT